MEILKAHPKIKVILWRAELISFTMLQDALQYFSDSLKYKNWSFGELQLSKREVSAAMSNVRTTFLI